MNKAGAVLVALIHGALILFLPLSVPPDIYNSPDETANALLTATMAQYSTIRRPVPQPDLPAKVAPRSLHRREDTFIPVGFPVFPVVVGTVAKLVTLKGIPYVLALLATLAVLAWFGLIKALFGPTMGFFSALLLAFHPAVLYWGSRPFVPQILALYLAVGALYLVARALRLRQKSPPAVAAVALEQPTLEQVAVKRRLASLGSGLCAGLAVALRPPEMLWLMLVFGTLLLTTRFRRRLSWLLTGVGVGLPLLGAAALNTLLYGSPLRTGYHLTPLQGNALQPLGAIMTPFGFNLAQTGTVFWQYLIAMFPIMSALTLLGLFMMLRRTTITARRLRFWAVGGTLLAIYFLQLYGSFVVQDRLDLAPSIGTSFTRYFLPLYLLATPLAAYGLRAIKFIRGGMSFVGLIVLGVGLFAVRIVFFSSDESVLQIRQVLRENISVREAALKIIPEQSIIFTERSDKIFFPYREVVTTFTTKWSASDFEAVHARRLYYETIADQKFVEKQNQTFWGRYGLRAVEPIDLGSGHMIYRLEQL